MRAATLYPHAPSDRFPAQEVPSVPTEPAPVLASFAAVAALLVAPLLAPPARAEAPLQRVAAARVCMVNDNLFPKDQIPVEVSGKTYFGCCEMCKDRLASDASLRTA